ncbi:hypothetical protein [Streptomyces sp. NBC_01353]|uniref:hypothetical protein n=1 Tax=Streptomyces sp. NBC_01353 TaxID=2903835 RepID=UPI002E3540A4|nr:hypothetical protein [Streptomyces sp. NBC_01353]
MTLHVGVESAEEPRTWTLLIDGKRAGTLRLERGATFGVTIDAPFGYGKIVQKAVDEAGVLRTIPDVIAAVERGYEELLKVEKRLKVVERESRPKVVSTPMGGRPK